MNIIITAWQLCRDSVFAWFEDGCAQLGAAIAFYTVISLAPLLIVVIMIAGIFWGDEAASGHIVREIDGLIGQDGAQAVQKMIAQAGNPSNGLLATIIGLFTLLFGATTVFYQLRTALNRIWGTDKEPRSAVTAIMRARFLALLTLLGAGFLLLVSLVISAAMAAVAEYTQASFPGAHILIRLFNFLVSLWVVSLLFALTFRVLPSANLKWKFALVGGLFTACLFSAGKFLIGWYLGQKSIGSVYGAAGSIVIILIWVYYSAQILLLGAEFTKTFHRRFGQEPMLEPPLD